jgi:hypothetical protein
MEHPMVKAGRAFERQPPSIGRTSVFEVHLLRIYPLAFGFGLVLDLDVIF